MVSERVLLGVGGLNMLTTLDTTLDQVGLLCGRAASSMGLIHTAYNTLSRVLQRNPQNGTCLLLLCENYWKQNQQAESNHAIVIDLLTNSLQNDSSISNASSPDVSISGARVNSNSTLAVVNGSLEKSGLHPLSSNYMVWTYLAVAYFHTNQIDQALKSITQATTINPNEPFLWVLQTRIISRWYFLMALDPQAQQQGAVPSLEMLLPYYINSIEWSNAKRDVLMQLESHLSLATLYFQFSLFDQSMAEMSFALNLLDSIQTNLSLRERLSKLTYIYTFIAVLHQRLNDSNSALQLLQQVKDLAPTETHVARCCITTAQISLLTNYEPQIEAAINILTSELSILSNLPLSSEKPVPLSSNDEFMLRYTLARCHSQLGNTETSYYQFQQLLKLFINHDYSPLVWTSIASLYLQLDQLADSLQAYSQAVQIAMDKLNDPAIVNNTSNFSNVYLSLKFYRLFAAHGWFGISQVYSKTDQIKDSLNALEQSIELFRSGGSLITADQLKQYYNQLNSQKSSGLNNHIPTEQFFPPDISMDLLVDFSAYNDMQSAFTVESLNSPYLNVQIPGIDTQDSQPSPNMQKANTLQIPGLQQSQSHQAQAHQAQAHQAQAQQKTHAISSNTSPALPRVMVSYPGGGHHSMGPTLPLQSAIPPPQQTIISQVPHQGPPQHQQAVPVYSVPCMMQGTAFPSQPQNAVPPPLSLEYLRQQPQHPHLNPGTMNQPRFG